MAKSYQVQMKQFNGTSYDEIYPKCKNLMSPQIIVTPTSTLSSVKATNQNGTIYNGEFKSPNWIIEVSEYGEYTITGTKTTGGVDSTKLVIDTCKQYETDFIPAPVPGLNNNTWAQIRKASDQGIAESLWAVGDAKQITINSTIGTVQYNNYQPWVYILGFNHNADKEGNNRIHFGCFRRQENYVAYNGEVALDDNEYGARGSTPMKFRMNLSISNSGGWKSSYMRMQVLDADATSPSAAANNSFLKALPSDLKAVMKSCTKYTDNTGGGQDNPSYVTATTDWVWLLSMFEVTGENLSYNSAERENQKQYQYYINGNTRDKYKESTSGTSCAWWIRSVAIGYTNAFYLIRGGGNSNGSSDESYGLSPAFCV